MSAELIHKPVMLPEVIDGLDINPDGIYVDGTYGRGGHSDAILEKLSSSGRLYAFDRDPLAIATAEQRHGSDERFQIFHEPFTSLESVLNEQQVVGKVDGILLDLGVSSPQLDDGMRGFSFIKDGPLDMRMDNSQGMTVAQWLETTSQEELANVLYEYGEEKLSRRIARAILEYQQQAPITTTKKLAEIIASVMPKRDLHKHPATRSFQALRIFINQELEQLQAVLQQALQVLKVNGRLAVISFHSLEDRIVKDFFRPQQTLKGLPLTDKQLAGLQTGFKAISKAIKPTEKEISDNPRSRSAVLRIAEKLS